MQDTGHEHPFAFAAVATLQRFETMPWYGKIAGLVAALTSAVFGDFVTGALLLAGGASLVDWYYGRAAAIKNGTYDKDKARYGWQVKGGTLLVILLIRGLEYWLTQLPAPLAISTKGALSTAVAVGVFADELDSIDDNLRCLGGNGIPVISPIITWLRSTASRFGAAIPNPKALHEPPK